MAVAPSEPRVQTRCKSERFYQGAAIPNPGNGVMPGIILSHKLVAAAIIVGMRTVLAMLGPMVVRRYVARTV